MDTTSTKECAEPRSIKNTVYITLGMSHRMAAAKKLGSKTSPNVRHMHTLKLNASEAFLGIVIAQSYLKMLVDSVGSKPHRVDFNVHVPIMFGN
jgi:hypothetical protein